jgi:tryptophan 2,3-dioxygenase
MNRATDIPRLIDPAGVEASAHARPMPMGSEAERVQAVAETGGRPMTEFAGRSNPYVDYESIDLLLSLQHPRSPGHDEMCFIVMGQVKELLFKALHHELHNARLRLDRDDVEGTLPLLDRAREIAIYIGRSWDVLSTILPQGFAEFRDYLGTASGQLSFMYRHVEFILGNKSVELAAAHRNLPHVWPALEAALNGPSLWDRAIALLARRGHRIDPQALDRDWSEPYRPDASVAAAWLAVYRDPVPENDLYRLAESLIALSDALSQYRYRHFNAVERIIGLKPGTGGSAGVGWLRAVVSHRFFPELWTLRTEL